jgi:hypothetical protein
MTIDSKMAVQPLSPPESFPHRVGTALVLLVGLVLPQVLLFGPCLTGQKYLLPLDLLTAAGHYLVPNRPDEVVLHNLCYADIVTHNEPDRQFAAAELRAGRLPVWNPYIYGGTPFVVWPKFAPHSLLYCLFPTPVTLAWLQLLKSVVAGLGAYLFFRTVLAVQRCPALVGAWCFPLTAYFILWQGCLMTYAVAGLPWLLLATEAVVRRPTGWGGPLLALTTGLIILSSSSDIAALVLLADGVYGLWRVVAAYVSRRWLMACQAAFVLACSWGLGIMLSLPQLLPLIDYSHSSARMSQRLAGYEARPPLPFAVALAQVFLPRTYGPLEHGYVQFFDGNFMESAAGAHVGLIATLFLAPLAWQSRTHRSLNCLWLVWIILGLGWQLDLPGLSQVLRLPYVNVLPYSRFVFAASFGIVAMAVVGLQVLSQSLQWRKWLWIFPALLAVVGMVCVWRTLYWPDSVGQSLELALQRGVSNRQIPDLATMWQVRDEYSRYHLVSALICCLGLGGWIAVWLRARMTGWAYLVVALVWMGELLWFGVGRNPQCDPALYYPRRPIFDALKQAEPGRILGVMCFPPNYCMTQQVHDIRGYDGVDPARMIDVLELARKGPPKGGQWGQLVQVQWFIPDLARTDKGALRVSPVLNMLNVRYFLFFGEPISGWPVKLQGDGFWVYENREAVPRAHVPRQVRSFTRDEAILAALAQPDFDPSRIAYLEGPEASNNQEAGSAEIVTETPTEVTLQVDMHAPGLVVLADRWDPDWHAYLDGAEVPLLRANYVLRGARAPAGSHRLMFRYEPASLYRGLWWMGVAVAGELVWIVIKVAFSRRPCPPHA